MNLLILQIGILSIISCKEPRRRENEITKVEVATGDCFGPCQLTAISIDSKLALNYYGGEILPGKPRQVLKGNFTGKISQLLWDTLNSKLEHIHYKLLDNTYEQSVDDQSLEMIIYYDNHTKHIKAQSASLPDSVRSVFYWIANVYKLVKLQSTKTKVKFNTTVQKPYRYPAPIDKVKFPPPKS